MRFRPCIDIHNGKVKQIVGGSLNDKEEAITNFASSYDAVYYANLYKKDGFRGGHIILLNTPTSPYYQETKRQAKKALEVFRGGLQIGGGITETNAKEYIELGASHVIVTSYIFQDGAISYKSLEALCDAVGKKHIVLDLSCRKKGGQYYVVTNKWQTFTDVVLTHKTLEELGGYCDEFLIHGVDVEGKSAGVEIDLVHLLSNYIGRPITYAGGIGSLEDLQSFEKESKGNLDFTIGSALDLFGGNIPYKSMKRF